MRSLSYLKQITINRKSVICYDPYQHWITHLVIRSEQELIIWSNAVVLSVKSNVFMSINTIRKVLFSNKRFFWKRKRRIGL